MTKGTVKWFNNAKGYGFILSEASGEDIFAHYSAIEMEGYKSLKAGQEVEFDIQNGDKGAHASNIRVSGESASGGTDSNSNVSQSLPDVYSTNPATQ